MDENVEQLFSNVEEKIIGLNMLLKHGKGFSKNYDQQLFKSVDFYVIDYEIYKYNSDSVKRHIGYLLDIYYALYNSDTKLTKIASLDEIAIEFSTIPEVANNLKNDLGTIINKLIEYRELINKRQNTSSDIIDNRKLKVSFADYLATIEIDDEPMFNNDTSLTRDQLKNSIVQFISKNLDEINPVIDLHTPNRKELFAYYVVSRLAELSGIPYVNIKNVSINGKIYSEVSGMTQRSRFNKKINEETYSKEFEEFINSFEEAIKVHLA